MFRLLALIATTLAIAAAPVPGQETLLFDVTRASTPAEPTVKIRISAAFDPADYAFTNAYFAIEATSGIFSDTECIPFPRHLCPDPPPLHQGPLVTRISNVQLHAPALGYFADRSNPVAIIKTRWRPDGPAIDDIEVITRTTMFRVYVDETGAVESRLDSFTEGSTVIRVRRCYTDCDGNDQIDFFDFLCFQDAFVTGDHYADCDASGELDFFDFLCFQNEFAAGCE